MIEVFGHRVGQAAGSLLIIGAVALGLSTQQLGIVLLALVAIWLLAIYSTRNRYVEEFRARLRQGVIDTRLELEELDRHSIDVLLKSVFLGSKHAARVMKPQGFGVILSTSSVAGIQGGLGPHAYNMAKTAIVGFTKNLAAELGPFGAGSLELPETVGGGEQGQ